MLDDLHAADVATVRLLEFLARGLHRARILAIATHRTGEARRDTELAAALADLGNAGAAARARRPLARRGPRAGRAAGAASAPPELVDRLHALTEGNPLFVDELMRLLAAEGALAAPGALGLRAPARAATACATRSAAASTRSSRRCAQALTAAAVIGPEFRLETLERVLVRSERTPRCSGTSTRPPRPGSWRRCRAPSAATASRTR